MVEFSSPFVEMDFIHEYSHQLNSPRIVGFRAVRNGGE